ncbi:MAG: hypothetical protein Q9178_006030 [Gyalolechia marmorata]
MASSGAPDQAASDLSADFYDSLGANYETAFGHDEGLAKFIETASSFMKPSSKVLDVGCGTGKPVAHALAGKDHHLTGIDIAPKMIELSRNAVPTGQFEVANMLDYEPKERMDAVLNIFSLFPLSREELEAMSRKWADWLVPGGILCIGAVAADSVNAAEESYDEDGLCARGLCFQFMGEKVELSLMTKKGWALLLEKAGFEVLHTEEDWFVPPVEARSDSEMHFFIVARRSS